jgi:hypothetical protein
MMDAEGRVFDVSEAVRTARAWMKRRVQAGQPALSGMFTRAEVTYAWPRPDGTVGSHREPVALFTGEAVHAYLGQLPDGAIEAMLNELSIELGVALPRGFPLIAEHRLVKLFDPLIHRCLLARAPGSAQERPGAPRMHRVPAVA